MDVSVIMINYNTFDLTKDALESIFAQTQGLAYEIILVDNLSPDGSGERLRDLFGDRIIYLQSGGNLGTSKAFNLGLRHATGKYILWLNTDILIKENFIKKLFDYMESDPKCGICGGNVLDFQGKPAISYDMQLLSGKTIWRESGLLTLIFHRLFAKSLSLHYNFSGRPKRVGGIIGADMMIRKSLFEIVGGFNEDIFMYGEETEFTYRVTHQTSYTVMSVPEAQIFHLEGGSSKHGMIAFHENKERIIVTGQMTYIKKWFGKEDARLLLKAWKKASRNKQYLYALMGQKEKKNYFRMKTEYFNRLQKDFDVFYDALKCS